MPAKCSYCHSDQVRISRSKNVGMLKFLFSVIRCQSCGQLSHAPFWAVIPKEKDMSVRLREKSSAA